DNVFESTVCQTIEAEVEIAADAEAGPRDIQITGRGDGALAGHILDRAVTVALVNIRADANHDGKIDDGDREPCKAIHGVQMLAGFGLAGHPALGDRVKVRLDAKVDSASPAFGEGEFSLKTSNRAVRIFSEAVGGDPWEVGEDGLAGRWRRPGETPPEFIYLEFPADGEVRLTLTFERKADEYWAMPFSASSEVAVVRLSNGLGSDDGISPRAPVIAGHASVNLASGNLYFGDTVSVYDTPAMGPDVFVSYNSHDGFDVGLGPGWRTNYGMRIFDGSADADGDGTISPDERKTGDLLGLIDESGRRFVFRYDAGRKRFVSDPGCGLVGAEVDADPSSFDRDGRRSGCRYMLLRGDNRRHFFRADGRLARVEDLRGRAVRVLFGEGAVPRRALDDSGRSESLLRERFEGVSNAPSGTPLLALSGGRSVGWRFGYAGGPGAGRVMTISVAEIADCVHTVVFGDGSGKVEDVGMPESRSRRISYSPPDSPAGSVAAAIEEPFGGTTLFEILPDSDAWTRMTDTVNVATERILRSDMRRVAKETAGRRSVVMDYDSRGNMILRSVSGGVSETWEYSDRGIAGANLLVIHTVAGAGGSTGWEYFTDDRRAGLVRRVEDPCGHATEYEYGELNGDGNADFLLRTKDSRGYYWNVLARDAFGQALEIETPEGRRQSFTWTDAGLMTSSTDILRYRTLFDYDSRGRLSRITRPGGAFSCTKYDALGRVRESRDFAGRVSATEYDGLGRPTKVTVPDLALETFRYSGPDELPEGLRIVRSRMVHAEAPGGGKTLVERILSIETLDTAGRTVSSSVFRQLESGADPVECVTRYEYTPAEGWLWKVRSPKAGEGGPATVYEYDDAGRVAAVTSPAGGRSRTVYHAAGWVWKTIDPDNRTTEYEYYPCGRIRRTINPAGGWVETKYLPTGQVQSVTPSAGNGTSCTYDRDGVRRTLTDEFGRTHVVELDAGART
ncbi:MAG: hypothetical protein N3A38_14575, partial [Planctomycetota bacterium]|nr:hypothetical protein [Planctomycetota bacterium]